MPDGAVGEALPGEVVEETLNEPLPGPVEDVVEDSPVAPVREELRRVVSGPTGGGGGGGGADPSRGTAPSGAAQTPAGGSTPGSRVQSPRRTSGRLTSGPRNPGRRSADGRSARPGARDRAAASPAAGRGDGRGRQRPADSRRQRARPPRAEDGRSPLTKTVDKLVAVVPTFVWVALGVMLLIALGLGVRTLVERRRALALAAEREELLRDLGLLERALLPDVPAQLGALAASVAYRPSEGPAAGGDFYDALELPGDRAAVLVGDVSGHGPDALERTNSTRSGLHACLEAGMSPRAALESVGRRAREDADGRFITVVVAVHDPASGTLTYATAGHPPPIVAGPCAHEPLTVASSPPIGVALRTGQRETTVPMPPGSVACFFTDGLLEARAGDGLFGRERLSAMVTELEPDEPADVLLDRVIAAADDTPDDMALCVLRPMSGTGVPSPRTEILEVEVDDLDCGVAESFLEACELPAAEAAVALEQLRDIAASSGGAVVEVTIDGDGRRACVAPAEPLAVRRTGLTPPESAPLSG